MLSFHIKFGQTDPQTDGRTTVKQYVPDLSMRGHKNAPFEGPKIVEGIQQRTKVPQTKVRNKVGFCKILFF